MPSESGQLTLPVGERDHFQGGKSAKVTLVEYGDYECPHCGRAYPIIKAVQKKMGDRLRFVFRNFPIAGSHPHAELAAEAAEAAAAQGKFWQMHDTLYENQDRLGSSLVLETARGLGLDLEEFQQDIESRKFLPRVKEDFMSGVRSGVNGTPGFFINGERFDGPWAEEDLFAALREAEK